MSFCSSNKFSGLLAVVLLAAAPLDAADLPFPGGDSKAPVEITSDSLEVQQEASRAVFRGNVLAAQGQTRLRAEEMTVHYRQQGGSQSADSPMGAISRIDVRGKVTLATAQENASADQGVYLVDEKKIRLDGNVILTKGKNVIKGRQLVYDLNTGRSVISAQQAAGEGGKQRVRALFVPEKEQGKP